MSQNYAKISNWSEYLPKMIINHDNFLCQRIIITLKIYILLDSQLYYPGLVTVDLFC